MPLSESWRATKAAMTQDRHSVEASLQQEAQNLRPLNTSCKQWVLTLQGILCNFYVKWFQRSGNGICKSSFWSNFVLLQRACSTYVVIVNPIYRIVLDTASFWWRYSTGGIIKWSIACISCDFAVHCNLQIANIGGASFVPRGKGWSQLCLMQGSLWSNRVSSASDVAGAPAPENAKISAISLHALWILYLLAPPKLPSFLHLSAAEAQNQTASPCKHWISVLDRYSRKAFCRILKVLQSHLEGAPQL